MVLRCHYKDMEVRKSNPLEEELASFRQQWQEELLAEKNKNKEPSSKNGRNQSSVADETESLEQQAAKLFHEGVQLERKGHFDAAVYYYRQAVRLVPDIEFKIAEHQVASKGYMSDSDDVDDEDNTLDISRYSLEPLSKQIEDLSTTGLCQPEIPQQETHISSLPTELLMVVVRWVVSKELDVTSLERLAGVCKWFYACARDEELWKSICIRVWGIHCTKTVGTKTQWRRMFMERPHLKYSGVYISMNSYIRIGEQSLDSFYKPCHLVEYYKYLRFFTDGTVIIYTSAEEPQSAIQLLNKPPYRDPAIYKGYYRVVTDSIVNIFYTRVTKPQTESRRRRHRGVDPSMDTKEYSFAMQLTLKDTRKKKNNQLAWNNYSYKIRNRRTGETSSENAISCNEFKSFIYSPVRSYSAKSYDIL